jgi:2'-5' RNA ligase
MKIVKGYSIWLKPTGIVRAKLAGIISHLSDEFKAPKFTTPHITLYENLTGKENDLIVKTSRLAKSLKPFTVKLTKIDSGKNFNNLVLLVGKTREIMNAYLKAKEICKIKPKKKNYIPHLTLLLKDITEKQRNEIIGKIGKEFNLEFKVKTIYLVPIGNKPENWIPIKRFYLKK